MVPVDIYSLGIFLLTEYLTISDNDQNSHILIKCSKKNPHPKKSECGSNCNLNKKIILAYFLAFPAFNTSCNFFNSSHLPLVDKASCAGHIEGSCTINLRPASSVLF
jgi:hypothetical protein